MRLGRLGGCLSVSRLIACGTYTIVLMAIHPIAVYGEPVLHRRAEKTTQFDADLSELVADMHETLIASNGVGLAAPQIGVGKAIFVINADDDYGERHRATFVNPVLIASKVPDTRPDPDEESEGCLSVPSLDSPLKRADRVTVNGVDEAGRPVTLSAQGWFARILQHEYDPLQ